MNTGKTNEYSGTGISRVIGVHTAYTVQRWNQILNRFVTAVAIVGGIILGNIITTFIGKPIPFWINAILIFGCLIWGILPAVPPPENKLETTEMFKRGTGYKLLLDGHDKKSVEVRWNGNSENDWNRNIPNRICINQAEILKILNNSVDGKPIYYGLCGEVKPRDATAFEKILNAMNGNKNQIIYVLIEIEAEGISEEARTVLDKLGHEMQVTEDELKRLYVKFNS